MLQPSSECVGIGTIRPDHLHVVLPVGGQGGEHLLCPDTIGKSGRMGYLFRVLCQFKWCVQVDEGAQMRIMSTDFAKRERARSKGIEDSL